METRKAEQYLKEGDFYLNQNHLSEADFRYSKAILAGSKIAIVKRGITQFKQRLYNAAEMDFKKAWIDYTLLDCRPTIKAYLAEIYLAKAARQKSPEAEETFCIKALAALKRSCHTHRMTHIAFLIWLESLKQLESWTACHARVSKEWLNFRMVYKPTSLEVAFYNTLFSHQKGDHAAALKLTVDLLSNSDFRTWMLDLEVFNPLARVYIGKLCIYYTQMHFPKINVTKNQKNDLINLAILLPTFLRHQFLLQALTPQTLIGHIFYTPRESSKPSIASGSLFQIMLILKQERSLLHIEKETRELLWKDPTLRADLQEHFPRMHDFIFKKPESEMKVSTGGLFSQPLLKPLNPQLPDLLMPARSRTIQIPCLNTNEGNPYITNRML